MTESVFGDGVDNDCDGLIDEELCTEENRGTDTDGDEKVDEDCAMTRELADGREDNFYSYSTNIIITCIILFSIILCP